MSLNLNTYLQELETLVNIDSPSKNSEGTNKVADYFEEKFKQIGWHVSKKNVDDSVGNCLIITNKEAESYDVLMIGHMDTVFPVGTTATRPFSKDDKRLYGPGVNDMKSGLLYTYYAAKYLTENNLLDNKAICIIFNSDEEISSRYSRPLIEEWAKKSKHALVLEPARVNGALVNQRKGIGKYFIEFHGIASHSGVSPELGASAIHELCNWVVALNAMNNKEKGTVVNVGVISGGTSPNVVAEYARFEMDIRITGMEELEKIENLMKDMTKNPQTKNVTVTIKGGITRPPMFPSKQSLELCNLVDEVGKSLGIDIEWSSTGGGSDANFCSILGVPSIDGLGPISGNAHAINEYVEIDSIVPRFNLLVGIIEKILKK